MKLAVRIISVPRPFYSMMYSGSPVFRLPFLTKII